MKQPRVQDGISLPFQWIRQLHRWWYGTLVPRDRRSLVGVWYLYPGHHAAYSASPSSWHPAAKSLDIPFFHFLNLLARFKKEQVTGVKVAEPGMVVSTS